MANRLPSAGRGYSLLEGMTILLIVSILVASGVPPLEDSIARSRASAELRGLIASLNLARTHAISKSTTTIVCGSDNDQTCTGDWQQGYLLFGDANNNQRLDEEDYLIQRGQALHPDAQLRWQASARRNDYIRFSRHGMAMEFGTFTYCPKAQQHELGRMLTINRMGRLRLAKDSNGDGLVEGPEGRTPQC